MQRTVKQTVITYAENTLTADGKLNTELKTITVAEADHKKAVKIASKRVGFTINPLKFEEATVLYHLDDETFFKYATVVE